MPKVGRKRKKTRTHLVIDEKVNSSLTTTAVLPKSFVLQHGGDENEVELGQLVGDVRLLMAPYTALKLSERKGAKIKDYVASASHLGVTHLLAFSLNKGGKLNLKVARLPTGPTLSFKVRQFSLGKQVRALLKRPPDVSTSGGLFQSPPVVVTNNFGGSDDATTPAHVKLMRITFQNMFPAVDVTTIKLNTVRRVVLFDYVKGTEGADGEEAEDSVDVRHFAVRAAPTGVNRAIKRLVQAKVPNLTKVADVADYVMGKGAGVGDVSDSEGEDEQTHVVLPGKFTGKGNNNGQKSALKLEEIGPRLKLTLSKVERGVCEGEVMYHAFVKKSKAEVESLKVRKKEEVDVKAARRKEQEENVARKQAAKDEKKARKVARREQREKEIMDGLRKGGAGLGEEVEDSGDDDSESEGEEDDLEKQALKMAESSSEEEEEDEEEEDSSDDEE
jgi:ribosome biogenesis protein SSF1/2